MFYAMAEKPEKFCDIEFRKYNAINSSHHTCLKRPILE
jgi:hypothetical protein